MSAEKETYVRRRAFNKIHVNSWLIYLERDGYVRCPFQNCNFMAFDVNEMCEHYGYCTGDNSSASFICEVCNGCTVSEKKLQEHRARAHNISVLPAKTDTVAEGEEPEPRRPSRVTLLSWGVFYDKYKYVKCSNCHYVGSSVTDMCRHYFVCKKEKKLLLYVCPECKGRSRDVAQLIQHLEQAHNLYKRPDQFNHISRNMTQYWEKELREDKFATCLHINNSRERDCEYIDVDLLGINEHSQTCKGPQQVLSKQWFCEFCTKWTSSDEKLTKHHILTHHIAHDLGVKVEPDLPQRLIESEKRTINNRQDTTVSRQSSSVKRLDPQRKNSQVSPNKELEIEISKKPCSTPSVHQKSLQSENSQVISNTTVAKKYVQGSNQNEMRRERVSTSSSRRIFVNVDSEPETIVPDLITEDCPFTVVGSKDKNKEIFLDLVEDKIVPRKSAFKQTDTESNMSEENGLFTEDNSITNLEQDNHILPDYIVSTSEIRFEEVSNGNYYVKEEPVMFSNTNHHITLQQRKSKTTILDEETDLKENHDKYRKSNSENSFCSEFKLDSTITTSQTTHEGEIKVIEGANKSSTKGKRKERGRRFVNEVNAANGDDDMSGKMSKPNKSPSLVLFKDELSSDEDEKPEKYENVVEENPSFDWYLESPYKNMPPKSYSRRRSSEDNLDRSSAKDSVIVCNTSKLETDLHQSSSIDDIGRASVINCKGKKSNESNFTNQKKAMSTQVLQEKTHYVEDSEKESSKNSEKNDKLMLVEISSPAMNKTNSTFSDQNTTSNTVEVSRLSDSSLISAEAVQEMKLNDQIKHDLTEDNSILSREIESSKPNFSECSSSKTCISIEEPSDPRVVSFLYSGKLKKTILSNDSPNSSLRDLKTVSSLEFVNDKPKFFNKPTDSGNQAVAKTLDESIKEIDDQNCLKLRQMTESIKKMNIPLFDSIIVHENNVVGSSSIVNAVGPNVLELKVGSTLDEEALVYKNPAISGNMKYILDTSIIENQHSSVIINPGTNDNSQKIESKSETKTITTTLDNSNVVISDKTPLDENHISNNNELDMKEELFNGFQEVSDNVYSKNRRFRQFITRISESENEEWYINAGNLSLDVRKDFRLSSDMSKPFSPDHKPLRNSNKKAVVLESHDNFNTFCETLPNKGQSKSTANQKSKGDPKGEESLKSNHNKNISNPINHSKVAIEPVKQRGVTDDETLQDVTMYSSSKETNTKSLSKRESTQTLKVSLSIDNLKIPSKAEIDNRSPPKYDNERNCKTTEETIVDKNKKVTGSSKKSVNQVKDHSKNKNFKVNKSISSKNLSLELAVNEQSNHRNNVTNELPSSSRKQNPSKMQKNELHNTAKRNFNMENSLIQKIKTAISEKFNRENSIDSVHLTSTNLEHNPDSKDDPSSKSKVLQTEVSDLTTTQCKSNFTGADMEKTSIGNSTAEYGDEENLKCRMDYTISSDDEPLSNLQKTYQQSVKTVLCSKDNLLTEGFSPHDHNQNDDLESEKVKNTNKAHLDSAKPTTKTEQINSANTREDLKTTKKRGRKPKKNKIEAPTNDFVVINKEKLNETAFTDLNNHNTTSNNCTITEQYDVCNKSLINDVDSHSTPKRRGGPRKRKMTELTTTSNTNEMSNWFDQYSSDNELLISIYSDELQNILVGGVFEKGEETGIDCFKRNLQKQQSFQGKGESSLVCGIVPKKRGKKRLSKLEIDSHESFPVTPISSEDCKVSHNEEINSKSVANDATSSDINEVKVPKRRGRPPKSKVVFQSTPNATNQSTCKEDVNSKLCNDLQNISNIETDCDTSVTKLPKKRGRKPKLQPELNNSKSSENPTFSSMSENIDTVREQILDFDKDEVAKKRGRHKRQPEVSENDTSCNFEGKDDDASQNNLTPGTKKLKSKGRRTTKLTSEVNDEENKVSNVTDMDCDESETSELLGTDLIIINEEKVVSSSRSLNNKTRRCRQKPPQKVVSEGDNSDDCGPDDSPLVYDDSEDDESYIQPKKRRRAKSNRNNVDGETVQTPVNKNNSFSKPGQSIYFKTEHHGEDKIVCGLCKKEMTYTKYKSRHAVFKHYMLSWIEGVESPPDMTNKKEIEGRLWYAKKRLKKTPFRCPGCNLPKLSAVGYYSHILFCGKDCEEKDSLLVTCKLCNARMMPSSIQAHNYVKHNKTQQPYVPQNTENQPRGPRAAAKRATQVIQKTQADSKDADGPGSRANSPDRASQLRRLYRKPSKMVPAKEYNRWKESLAANHVVACTMEGCNFTAGSTIDFRKHYFSCPFKPPQFYQCRHCEFNSLKQEQMVDHVEENHLEEKLDGLQGSEDDSSEPSGDDEGKPPRAAYASGSTQPFKFLRYTAFRQPRNIKSKIKRLYTPALKWTHMQRQRMFAKERLYPEAQCQTVPGASISSHLPELTESITNTNQLMVSGDRGCLLRRDCILRLNVKLRQRMFAKERLYPEAQCQTVPGASISSHLPELTESITNTNQLMVSGDRGCLLRRDCILRLNVKLRQRMFAKERLYPEAQCQTVPGASISSHLPELTESITNTNQLMVSGDRGCLLRRDCILRLNVKLCQEHLSAHICLSSQSPSLTLTN
ncbi:uncharacterized protein LOC128989208 [Macrosteles quadrilineatus]|uniref:uncharacterized protein LOC128989208 n=1 Tax=Macrosteles quadrilineatus TaxID=74068 RepID=UPI0023E1E8B9|nr:uncharacterized protein LOC128989208 [Macrosteles quadrilineatus]